MDENRNIERELIDKETGEVITVYEGDSLRIVREQQKEAIKLSLETKQLNEEVSEWNEELGGFVFVLFKYCNNLLEQHKEITPEDITKLFYLATYVDYDGYLVYDGQYMTRANMQNILGLSINIFDVFFNKMKKIGIFSVDKCKNIKINKRYFSKGEIDKEIQQYYDYTRVYIDTIRYLYNNVDKRNQKQLGNYFKLIPYIHRQQNTLCHNPSDDISNIKLMTVNELKDILGYHRNGVRGFIKELLSTRLDNNEAILGFFRTEYDEGKSYIIVNPKVFYGGNFKLKNGRNEVIKWFIK
jgi:hypothetical protein